MTLQEFITAYNNKGWDFDGYYGDQCMDLFEFYNRDVIGAPAVAGNAIDVPNTYPKNFYSWIANTPAGIPAPGDIVIWGSVIGQYGHIAIFISGDANSFTSLDQNWPLNSLTHEQAHDYNGVLGWLHPITQAASGTIYKGIDLTNTASVKVCVDMWDAIVNQHQYVAAADVNAICTTLGVPTGSGKDAINAAITKLQNDKITAETNNAQLTKQIPDLEGQISTLTNEVASLQQQLLTAQTAQNDPVSGLSYQSLFNQAEQNIKTVRQNLADLTEKTNRQIAQLQNSSATTMPLRAAWKIVFARSFRLS